MQNTQLIAIIISQILALVILFAVSYILYMTWKGKNRIMRDAKELAQDEKFMKVMRNVNAEPDELIEQWQQGYAIGVKNLLHKHYQSFGLVDLLKIANGFPVIKELPGKFVLSTGEGKVPASIILVNPETNKPLDFSINDFFYKPEKEKEE